MDPGDAVMPTGGEPEIAEAADNGMPPEARDGGGCITLFGDTFMADSLAARTVSGDGGPPKGTAVPAASASSAAYRARERSRLACTCAAEPTSVSSRRCASSRSDSSCDSPAAWEGACEGGEDEAGPPADSAGKGGAEEKASDGCCAITGMPPTERAHTSAL